MQTIDEVREHCRFVGEDIEMLVADGDYLNEFGNGEMKVFHVPETKNSNK